MTEYGELPDEATLNNERFHAGTELIVGSEGNLPLAGFVYCVEGLARHPWTKRGPLLDVPDDIINRAAELPNLRELSFARDPMSEANEIGLPQAEHDFLQELQKLYEALSTKYQEKLGVTKRGLQEFVSCYGDILPRITSTQTGCDWPAEKSYVIPTLYSGGTVHGPMAFIGFPGNYDQNRPMIFHELTHVNTDNVKKELYDDLQLGTDSNEITTVILTNKIIDEVNKKTGHDIPANQYSKYYREFIAHWEDDFKVISEEMVGYSDIIKAVDKFFIENDYKGYFKQHGI